MIRYRGVPKFPWLSYNVGIRIQTLANSKACEWVQRKAITTPLLTETEKKQEPYIPTTYAD